MNIYKVKDRHGNRYLYNEDNIFQLCWAWENAANLANFVEKEEKTGLGSIYSLEPNTQWIFGHFGKNFKSRFDSIEQQFISSGGESTARQLISLRNQTRKYLDIYFDKVEKVNQKNAHSLTVMDRWVTGAKVVRDFGATTVVVGTSVMAMPFAAAAGLLTAGAGVKAYGKYTDTGNVGAAGVEFVCEMGVGLLGVGAKAAGAALSAGEKICIVLFAKMPAEAAKSVVSGESFKEGAVATLTAGLLAGASEGVSNLLGRFPVPASLKEGTILRDLAELARGITENTIEDMAKNKAKEIVSGKGSNKQINFDKLKASHINLKGRNSEEDFVRKYCLTRI